MRGAAARAARAARRRLPVCRGEPQLSARDAVWLLLMGSVRLDRAARLPWRSGARWKSSTPRTRRGPSVRPFPPIPRPPSSTTAVAFGITQTDPLAANPLPPSPLLWLALVAHQALPPLPLLTLWPCGGSGVSNYCATCLECLSRSSPKTKSDNLSPRMVNRRARHEYHILEKLEVGVALQPLCEREPAALRNRCPRRRRRPGPVREVTCHVEPSMLQP